MSPTRSFHPLRTSTRAPLPDSSSSHSTNRASSSLNGPTSNGTTSFRVKHSLGLRAGSRLAPAGSVTARVGLQTARNRGRLRAERIQQRERRHNVTATGGPLCVPGMNILLECTGASTTDTVARGPIGLATARPREGYIVFTRLSVRRDAMGECRQAGGPPCPARACAHAQSRPRQIGRAHV